MEELQVIYNQEVFGQDFKIYGTEENPLFLAKDVANWIEHSNPSKMVKDADLDDAEVARHQLSTLTNSYTALFLTEDGLYEVLMQSRKPIAKQFKKKVKEILKQIRKTGGYIPHDEDEDDETIMAKALIVAQKTIDNKNKLLEDAKKEIAEKDRVITQISISQNTKLVRETAKAISKSNSKILIGERRLYERLRSWGWVCKNSTEATQYAVERGYLEVSEGTKKTARGTFTFRTTRVTGKGEIKIIEKLLKEKDLEKLLEENEKSK